MSRSTCAGRQFLRERSSRARRLALLALLCAAIFSDCSGDPYQTFFVPMRDGVLLASDLFQPAGAGALPTVVIRTPYGRYEECVQFANIFNGEGFAAICQDIRGTGDSEGVFELFRDDGWGCQPGRVRYR